jgi:hypothetical protein
LTSVQQTITIPVFWLIIELVYHETVNSFRQGDDVTILLVARCRRRRRMISR